MTTDVENDWSLEAWKGNTEEYLLEIIGRHQRAIAEDLGSHRNEQRRQWIAEIKAELASRKQSA